jgi:Zn-dependent peptidase ImmA (M78 family)
MVRRDFWQAEMRAAEVLAARKMDVLPVDPFAIASSVGIVCQKVSSGSPGGSGCLAGQGGTFGIFYNDSYSNEGLCRFTVAHELGHWFLDGHYKHVFADGNVRHESDSCFGSDDPIEKEADTFAAALLMPPDLFREATQRQQTGLTAIENLAQLCGTSLTATAIRYADLSDEQVVVVCSMNNRVVFSKMSDCLKKRRDLAYLKKNSGIPEGTATSIFNKDLKNVLQGKRTKSWSTMDTWFDCGGVVQVNEEVKGLGNYGRTLTILWAETPPVEPDDEDSSEEDELENMLPSDRWRQPREE